MCACACGPVPVWDWSGCARACAGALRIGKPYSTVQCRAHSAERTWTRNLAIARVRPCCTAYSIYLQCVGGWVRCQLVCTVRCALPCDLLLSAFSAFSAFTTFSASNAPSAPSTPLLCLFLCARPLSTSGNYSQPPASPPSRHAAPSSPGATLFTVDPRGHLAASGNEAVAPLDPLRPSSSSPAAAARKETRRRQHEQKQTSGARH